MSAPRSSHGWGWECMGCKKWRVDHRISSSEGLRYCKGSVGCLALADRLDCERRAKKAKARPENDHHHEDSGALTDPGPPPF